MVQKALVCLRAKHFARLAQEIGGRRTALDTCNPDIIRLRQKVGDDTCLSRTKLVGVNSFILFVLPPVFIVKMNSDERERECVWLRIVVASRCGKHF